MRMGAGQRDMSGWLSFAGILAIMIGLFNAVDGLIALFQKHYFAITSTKQLVMFNLTGWGWFFLILGLIQIGVGFGILAGKTWARGVGIALAGLAALLQLMFFQAAPLWSAIVIALCVLVIYGLIVPPKGATG
jgi:hypothetical protein